MRGRVAETVTHRFVGVTTRKDKEPNRINNDIRIHLGAVDRTLKPRGQLPGTWKPPVGFGDDRYTFGISIRNQFEADWWPGYCR